MEENAAAPNRASRFIPRGQLRLIISGVVALALVATVAQVAVARINGLPKDAVLRTGDHTVTKAEFSKRLGVLKAVYGVRAPKGGAKLDQFNRDGAKSQAVSLILDRAAKKRDIVISNKSAEQVLERLIEDQMPGGRTSFVQYLSANRLSETNVLDETKRQMATTKLVEKVAGGQKTVTEDQAKSYYDERKTSMVSREGRHLSNIVVETESEAQSIHKQATAGASFRSLAAKYTRDASTKDKGGDLGTLTADQLEPDFAEAAFGTKKHEVFGPVKTRFGWNVGKVESIKPSKSLSFAEVKKELVVELQNQKTLKVWRAWLAHELKSADVEYADKYRPKRPDAAPAGLPN